MSKLAGVKLPYSLSVLECSYEGISLGLHDFVVVDTDQGLEIGKVVFLKKKSDNEKNPSKIVRIATDNDLQKKAQLEDEARGLFTVFSSKILKYKLKMTPLGVGYSLDGSKIVFYFSADGRVDFRELARDLSRSLKKQAIMRQVGPRDQAKLIGGYGRCGLPVCCASFMNNAFNITMDDVESAYGMPKNAAKISGLCGRLMCCVKFEQGFNSKEKGDKK